MRKRSCALLACLLAAPVAAQAPRARIAAVLENSSEFPVPPLADVPMPPTPPSVPAYVASSALLDGDAWGRLQPASTLPAADQQALGVLLRSLPGFNERMVRVLPREKAEEILDQEISLNPGIGPLGFFTSNIFKHFYSYYVPKDDLCGVFRDFKIKTLTPILGKTVHNREVPVRGLLIGHGVIAVVYDRSFEWRRKMDDGRSIIFKFDSTVIQQINPDASLSLKPITGVYVQADVLGRHWAPVQSLYERWIYVWNTRQKLDPQTPIKRQRARS